MRVIEASVEIDAPPEAVWDVLIEFGAYGEWNPVIRAIEGDLRENARFRVQIDLPGLPPVSFAPTVVALDPGRRLRWLGRVPIPGVAEGRHEFRIDPIDGGRSRFVQREEFSGVAVRVLPVASVLAESYDEMNQALKDRVESTRTQQMH
jgi:hypothetical protein